jgi:DNA-binding transcriptional LysR family regulator
VPGAAELTPAILRAFSEARPQCRLTVQSLGFAEHVSAVVEHRVDVAFVRPAPVDERVMADVLTLEPRIIIAPVASELADADGLRVCDVLDLDYVGLPESTPQVFTDYVCFASARNGTRARWTPDVAMTGPAVVISVAAGQGIGTTLYSCSRFYRSPGVCFVPILDAPWESSVLITRRNDPRPEVGAFRDLAVTLARTLGPKLLSAPKLTSPSPPPDSCRPGAPAGGSTCEDGHPWVP